MQLAINDSQEPVMVLSKPISDKTRKVAVGGMLGALSIAVSTTATFIPRLPLWGIALFDPVSLIWIIAFLIGGIEVGIITTYAGSLGLFLFDPTGVGPVFKFLATVPMILIPWLGAEFSKSQAGGQHLSSAKKLSIYMVIAFIIRLGIMVPLNLVMVPLLFGLTDTTFIITYTLVLNSLQSLWDALIPYLIVHKTGLFESFRMW
ncbi:MAG: hypothetical protein ACXAEF_02130 [Candidatus Thorarchaeota archaeon]|jgi:hypothetical protein